MRWWYIRYEDGDDVQIEDYWVPQPGQKDSRLAFCDAAWDARSYKGRAIQFMFVVDDAEPVDITMRCRGTVEKTTWMIWERTSKERQRRRGY